VKVACTDSSGGVTCKGGLYRDLLDNIICFNLTRQEPMVPGGQIAAPRRMSGAGIRPAQNQLGISNGDYAPSTNGSGYGRKNSRPPTDVGGGNLTRPVLCTAQIRIRILSYNPSTNGTWRRHD
jgi:hypothetical protein